MKVEMFRDESVIILKDDVNKWLKAHKNIKIQFVKQSERINPLENITIISIWYTK